ncbi:hypothetical protein AB0B30_35055 [Streptomyces narbonensis]|uniref:YCII-related domain-containing protein n=1 Tax=Streptomyces narbonensis TaxID=67333 RepID=A0ABV3CI14_9ACTN
MYLVHAHLAPPAFGEAPGEVMRQIRASVLGHRDVQFVACHPDGPGGPVLGIFALATSVEEAEERIAALCRSALNSDAGLRGWSLGRCEVVLALPGSHPRIEDGPDMA